MSDTRELKSCPFCGETNALTVDNLAGDDWYVECGACKVQQHAIYPTCGAAIAAWNRRAALAAPAAAICPPELGDKQSCFSKPAETEKQTPYGPAIRGDVLMDAERYRWLRAGNDYEREAPMVLMYEKDSDTGDRPYWSLSGEALDSSVDAAIASQQETK